MYTPAAFKPDRATSLGFAAARGFGTVCAWDGQRPVASPVPFCLDYGNDGTPHLTFHVARHNPLARLAGSAASWLMAVSGADAYVSADWYASPDQVPTWLYQAVHLSGAVRMITGEALAAHLDMLSTRFERTLAPKPPWTTAKMTTGRLEAMKKAIVGLTMAVDEVDGSFKLNQHKSDSDALAVAGALAAQDDQAARTVAAQMVALRSESDAIKGVPPGLATERTCA